jgi:FG-GAP-like repeat
MRLKSILSPVAACCCLLLTFNGNSQQFKSSRRVTPYSQDLAHGFFAFGPIYGVADFNEDGRPDFLSILFEPVGSNGASLMLQKSDGSFSQKAIPTLAIQTTVVADMNQDGHADIVTALNGPTGDHGEPLGPPATVVVSFGNGNGTFNIRSAINLTGNPYAVAIKAVDLNGDKRPDLVIEVTDQYADAVIETLINIGGGKFKAGPTYSSPLTGEEIFATGDFNGDGFADLVVQNNFQTEILLGKGDGSFHAVATYNVNPSAVAAGDLNGDHHQDLVLVGSVMQIMLGDGKGNFHLKTTLDSFFGLGTNGCYGSGVYPDAVYISDLNRDGRMDVAFAFSSCTQGAAVFPGNGDGTLSSPKVFNVSGAYDGNPGAAAFADFSGDGRPDLLMGSYSAGYVIAYGDTAGGFQSPVISQAPNAGSIAKGDFNGDGIDDVAVVNEALCSTCNASVTVFLGTGKGYLQAPKTYLIAVQEGAIAVGDVNGDGKPDIAVTRNAGLINIGYVVPPTPSAATKAAPSRHAAASAPALSPDLSILLGRGDGTFDTPMNAHVLGAPTLNNISPSVYLVDVNHDGKLDLIGDWGTALGKGNGQFGSPIPLPSGIHGIVALAPGDFNGNGKIGLAVASDSFDSNSSFFVTPSYVYILTGTGNGSFAMSKKISTGLLVNLIADDLDGDGLTDILYTTSIAKGSLNYIDLTVGLSKGQNTFTNADYPRRFTNGGDVALLRSLGGGTFSKIPEFYQGTMDSAVAVNLDADTAPDIAGTTVLGIARLLNTGRK